jgi:hypothetical protein
LDVLPLGVVVFSPDRCPEFPCHDRFSKLHELEVSKTITPNGLVV